MCVVFRERCKGYAKESMGALALTGSATEITQESSNTVYNREKRRTGGRFHLVNFQYL